GVSAMVESANQTWLNSIWSHAASAGADGYYPDSIRLLSMIVMSGNWWAPSATSGTPPTITSTAVTTATAGSSYSYDVNASGSPTPTYSLTTFPTGMSINTTTGAIAWTPSTGGSFPVTVKAANGVSPDATQSFSITVSSTAPAITSTPGTTAVAGN